MPEVAMTLGCGEHQMTCVDYEWFLRELFSAEEEIMNRKVPGAEGYIISFTVIDRVVHFADCFMLF